MAITTINSPTSELQHGVSRPGASISGNHLLGIDDVTQKQVNRIMEAAGQMQEAVRVGKVPDLMRGLVLTTLFFEPSTRTRLSFESAMIRLGGGAQSVVGGGSSLEKSESLADTGRVVSAFADVIVMRHSQTGSVAELASGAKVPVINAGDGINEHPTQALLDLYTALSFQGGNLEGKVVACMGDLKNGRAVHSFIKLFSRYGVRFIFISAPSLGLPDDLRQILKRDRIQFDEVNDLTHCIGDLDVLYMTRLQRERFKDNAEFEAVGTYYQLSRAHLVDAKPSLSILHPLPRVNEISSDVDDTPFARYFDQVRCGLYVRMAILALVTGRLQS